MTSESKHFRIFIYNNQFNSKQFEIFVRKFEYVENLKYNGLWYTGWFHAGSVTFSDNCISVFYYEDSVDIKEKTLSYVKNNLNAEYIITSENGQDEKIVLDNYNPSWYDKLKRKIKNKVSKW